MPCDAWHKQNRHDLPQHPGRVRFGLPGHIEWVTAVDGERNGWGVPSVTADQAWCDFFMRWDAGPRAVGS